MQRRFELRLTEAQLRAIEKACWNCFQDDEDREALHVSRRTWHAILDAIEEATEKGATR